MAFKMKKGGSAFPYGNSPMKDEEEKEKELATEDKAWEDLTDDEKISRQNTIDLLKGLNESEKEKNK